MSTDALPQPGPDPEDEPTPNRNTVPAPAGDVKELRLGLVCYGGVSLAIYMHGMTKERPCRAERKSTRKLRLHTLRRNTRLLDAAPGKRPIRRSFSPIVVERSMTR